VENKKQSLFRQKNIERIESPEAMNDYLQVTSPGVWLVLAAVIVFLIGACIWGIFGHIDSTIKAAVVATRENTVCLVPQTALESVIENRTMKIDGNDYELAPATLEPVVIAEDTNVYWLLAGNLSVGDIVYRIPLSQNIICV
jgi:hypothetical protein